MENLTCQGEYINCLAYKSLIQPLGQRNLVGAKGKCQCSGPDVDNMPDYPSTCRAACRKLKKTLPPGILVRNMECKSKYAIECQVYEHFVKPWALDDLVLENGACSCQ